MKVLVCKTSEWRSIAERPIKEELWDMKPYKSADLYTPQWITEVSTLEELVNFMEISKKDRVESGLPLERSSEFIIWLEDAETLGLEIYDYYRE